MNPLRKINVVLIDDNADTLRNMEAHIEVACGDEPMGVTRWPPTQGLQETNLSESFHVFLSHNSQDKPIVRELAQALKLYDLRVWLDEDQLVPGRPFQEGLETVIETTQAAAVLIGEGGLGPWERTEMRSLLSEFVDRKLPVIPVLLPGILFEPKLPLFLRSFTWVDLREGLTDPGLEKLVWGITGEKPANPSRFAGGGLLPESIQCKLHAFKPEPSHTNPNKIDINKTLKKILCLNPGVAIIDLKLEGDAAEDYTGADLALRIKKSCIECCIILVSSYFDADSKFLDNIEIFRFRVNRDQEDYGKNLRKKFIDAVRHNDGAIKFGLFLKKNLTLEELIKTDSALLRQRIGQCLN